MHLHPAKTTAQIEVLFGVETWWPRDIVLDGGSNFPDWFDAVFYHIIVITCLFCDLVLLLVLGLCPSIMCSSA